MTDTDATHGLRWRVTKVVSATDGDTIRLCRERAEQVDDVLSQRIYDDPVRAPRGVAVRLVWVDTPEKSDHDAWAQARADTASWLVQAQLTRTLEVVTYGGGGFDRILGDVGYYEGDRWCSLSQWLMAVKGWPPYVRGA